MQLVTLRSPKFENGELWEFKNFTKMYSVPESEIT